MLRRSGATTTGKYSLMLSNGNSGLGSNLIGNLVKNNFGNKSPLLKVIDVEQENKNNNNNIYIKAFHVGKKNKNEENNKVKNENE